MQRSRITMKLGAVSVKNGDSVYAAFIKNQRQRSFHPELNPVTSQR
jgi:hypothetical protein